jgi:hypothetical protein
VGDLGDGGTGLGSGSGGTYWSRGRWRQSGLGSTEGGAAGGGISRPRDGDGDALRSSDFHRRPVPWWQRWLQRGICHKRCLPLDQLEREHWRGWRGGGRQRQQLLDMEIKACIHRLQQRQDTIQLGRIRLGEDGGGRKNDGAGHDGDAPGWL